MSTNTTKRRNIDQDTPMKPHTTMSNPLMTKLQGLVDNINATIQTQDCVMPDAMKEAVGADLTAIVGLFDKVLGTSKKALEHVLFNLHTVKPNEDELKELIDIFPEALLSKQYGCLPIQHASYNVESKRYVPLLAAEASRRKIGPERGGLLLSGCRGEQNVFEYLVNNNIDAHDLHLSVLKELRSEGLLLDQDIIQFNLIEHAAECPFGIFEYLLSLYPKALSIRMSNGNLPIQEYDRINWMYSHFRLERLLPLGMEHYPQHFGFLFKQNANGQRAITQAIRNSWSRKRTLRIIEKAIPPSQQHPILHHVLRYTPHLLHDFIKLYPDALYLKDREGHYLFQVAVQCGLKLPLSVLMPICKRAYLEQEDEPEVMNLYPFMLAAAEDVSGIYELLRRTSLTEVISSVEVADLQD